MRTRTTLLLLALAVAIGAYLYFFERNRPSPEEAQRRSQNVVNFERDKIDGIVIQNGDERTELKRIEKTWRLESPLKDLADGSAVESLLFDLEGWQKEATIDAKEIEADKNRLAEYGVSKAKLRLKLQGAGAPPEILFGNNAALEGRTYVRLENSKEVYIASQSVKNAISKKPDDFRDHKLTETVASQVNRIALKTAAGEMELQKDGDHWQIVKPLRARADDQKVNDLLAQVTTSRIAQFVSDDRGDLHPYGLAEPRGSLTIFTPEDKQGQLLQIGAAPEKRKEEVYVRFAPRSFVFTVPKTIEQVLNAKPNDLRDRHLVRFDKNQLDRVTIEAPTKTKTILARKGENWVIANRNDQPANSAEVRRLIQTMADEQATSFVADVSSELPKYGLDHPQLLLTLSSFASENTAETAAGERPLAKVALGRVEGENLFARVDEDPFVLAVRPSLLANLFADPVQWQELSIFKFKAEEIHRLSLAAEREQTVVRGPSKQWEWIAGTGPINTVNVQSLVNTLSSLRAVRWVTNAPPQAFEKPQLILTFTTSPDDKAMHKLLVGGPSGDGMWFARVEGREGTFVISNPDLNALRLPLAQTPSPAPVTGSPPAGGSPPGAPATTISPSPTASP